MKTIRIILPSLLLAVSTSVFAETEVDAAKVSGFYIGAGYGSFSYETDSDWDDDQRYGRLTESTDGNTLKMYGGYQFNKIIGVEATYTDYGDTEGYVRTLTFNPIGIKNQEVTQSPTAISVAANAGYSFNNGLRPFALLGLSYMTLDSSYAFLDTDNPIAIRYGFGLDYAPAMVKGIQLRVAYEGDIYLAEAYNGYNNDADIDIEVDIFALSSFYAGVSYKF
ncbi:MAG: porin family protein [Psychromonas sp.]|nr:porin family protein [Psychromonas sp.]